MLAREKLGYGYVRLRPARAETCVPSFHRACHQPQVLERWNVRNRAGLPEDVPSSTESWNVRERACLPGNVPSNKMVRFHPSWLTRKRSIEQGGTLSTEMAYPKTFHRKVGCQNGIEKSSFFVRRSRNRHFPRAKKPFLLMARDGTFSIGKTSNCNHLRAGAGGVTRRC